MLTPQHLQAAILNLIIKADGISAREIAEQLNLDKKSVNSLLYTHRLPVTMDDNYRWRAKGGQAPRAPIPSAPKPSGYASVAAPTFQRATLDRHRSSVRAHVSEDSIRLAMRIHAQWRAAGRQGVAAVATNQEALVVAATIAETQIRESALIRVVTSDDTIQTRKVFEAICVSLNATEAARSLTTGDTQFARIGPEVNSIHPASDGLIDRPVLLVAIVTNNTKSALMGRLARNWTSRIAVAFPAPIKPSLADALAPVFGAPLDGALDPKARSLKQITPHSSDRRPYVTPAERELEALFDRFE